MVCLAGFSGLAGNVRFPTSDPANEPLWASRNPNLANLDRSRPTQLSGDRPDFLAY